MKIFIDFDDVLFNTKKFILELKKIFHKHGVSEELFSQSYIEYPIMNADGKLKKYDVYHHIDILEKNLKMDVVGLRKDIKKFIKETGEYIFPDAGGFLDFFGRENIHVISYGETKLQVDKIGNSGIRKKVKNVSIIDKLKSGAVEEIIKKYKIRSSEKICFLDDRVEQLEDVKKRYPEIKTILVKRKEGRYNDEKNRYCDFEIKNLIQAKKIINKI